MVSFSQVVQDAPYGIQGVANNIQQLTMQMGYLSKGAGGAKGAFGRNSFQFPLNNNKFSSNFQLPYLPLDGITKKSLKGSFTVSTL